MRRRDQPDDLKLILVMISLQSGLLLPTVTM